MMDDQSVWHKIANLVESAIHDENVRRKLRTGTPEEKEAILRTHLLDPDKDRVQIEEHLANLGIGIRDTRPGPGIARAFW